MKVKDRCGKDNLSILRRLVDNPRPRERDLGNNFEVPKDERLASDRAFSFLVNRLTTQ